MFIEMEKRKYTKKRRAEQQEKTRERIVAAAVALHEELGPAQTTIKALAERAGVQRLTVYRHFPDEASLFEACSSQWLMQNPPPAVDEWQGTEPSIEKCRQAFKAFFSYYRRTQRMWHQVYQDEEKAPAMAETMKKIEAYMDQVRDDLLKNWDTDKKRKKYLSVTIRHCLRFSTWLSLEKERLSDKDKVTVAVNWLRGIMDCEELAR